MNHEGIHRTVRARPSTSPFALAALLSFLPLTHAQSPQVSAQKPVKNFSLPTFNAAGFRTMHIKGGEAVRTNSVEARLRDMVLTVFSGDEAARVENVLLSQSATVNVQQRTASGDEAVRLIGDTFELTGTDWHYDHEKKSFTARNARVVFNVELSDILK